MRNGIYILMLMLPLLGWAQDGEPVDPEALRASRDLTLEANKELADSDFVSAEANYRKAISKSSENSIAPYNLGNAYYVDGSYGEAFGRYKEAGERAFEKGGKHMAYHNMGNVYMQRKEYQQAVEAYKEALRNDPTDEETRYNLALAKEMLKKEQEQQQQNEDDQDQEQEDQQENQDQNQDQNEGDSEQNQDQQEDQQQEGDSEKEDNKEGEGEQKQEEDRKPKESGKQPRPNQLSPQQIQNLLQAMENEEKKVKEKIDARKVKGTKVTTEKDW